jgi:hypothetical protein
LNVELLNMVHSNNETRCERRKEGNHHLRY